MINYEEMNTENALVYFGANLLDILKANGIEPEEFYEDYLKEEQKRLLALSE